MRFPLKPLNQNEERAQKPFAVVDIETKNWTDFLVLGYYDAKILKFFKHPKGIVAPGYIHDFIEWLFAQPGNPEIFAHFGGRFDFLFLIRAALEMDEKIEDMIPMGSGLMTFTLTRKHKKIKFWDSAALLPYSLKQLTKNFDCAHAKKDYDHSTTKKVTPELLEYLTYDLKGLYEVIEKYSNSPIVKKAGRANTSASQALRVLRCYIDKPVSSLSENVDEEIRHAFFGGRTEIFIPFYRSKKKPLFCYDKNSLYPFVCGGQGNHYPNDFKHETDRYQKGKLGIYSAIAHVPAMHIPPLGVKIKGKYVFPTGTFRGYFTSAEIEYAKQLGCTFKIKNGFIFSDRGEIFKEFITDLYRIRQETTSPVDNDIAKKMMNSCWGRFALRNERENVVFDDGRVGLTPFREIKVKGKTYRLATEEVDLSSFSNVAIGCFVTAYARIEMHKLYMIAPSEAYYTDTDSLYTTREMPTGKNLGELKLESDCWSDREKQYSACFLQPKAYIAGDKIVMKGFDKKKIQSFTIDDFFSCLEGSIGLLNSGRKRFRDDEEHLKIMNEPKFATMRAALKNGYLVGMLKGSPKQIRSAYDKRVIVKQGRTYVTTPIHIGEK